MSIHDDNKHLHAFERIRIRGIVQGVGFRPVVWRIATECHLSGEVFNDADGVIINVSGDTKMIDHFIHRLREEAPPLARIDAVEREAMELPAVEGFSIIPSKGGKPNTGIAPDAAVCQQCLNDISSPDNRRYHYPFTNCTHCGPRLSIIKAIPYDRKTTAMASFSMCAACEKEYQDPANRRFHAQPNACSDCGPKIWLETCSEKTGAVKTLEDEQALETICELLNNGEIVAIKGIGGFHLACDARNEMTVQHLRAKKRRYGKPFALMAKDIVSIQQFCKVNQAEKTLLQSAAAPIVLLEKKTDCGISASVAPGQSTLGCMLPYSPLHYLILQHVNGPLIMTSGNLSDEPQCTDNAEAIIRLGNITRYFLMHDRDIINRVDDSVVRIVNDDVQLLRRARGYAPGVFNLPSAFEEGPDIMAMGGELKNTFCLLQGQRAIVSQHIGDLESAATLADYERHLQLYQDLYLVKPTVLSIDLHPEYLSSKLGRMLAEKHELKLDEVQHHHAHIASCLAENNVPADHPPVLGIALDGLGFGEDATLWGGEILLADYKQYQRLAFFKPVAMPGAAQAIYEPWRNTYAHIKAAIGWEDFASRWDSVEVRAYLTSKPIKTMSAMIDQGINSPLASSCGRLFDAVAAAVGVCRDVASYEGQAAIELEALVDKVTLREEDETSAYTFTAAVNKCSSMLQIDPAPMWVALFDDLAKETPVSIIAARFHKGLANSICTVIDELAKHRRDDIATDTVALSGGVMQNKILSELLVSKLEQGTYKVLTQKQLPPNDGGLSLGQALVTAARNLKNFDEA